MNNDEILIPNFNGEVWKPCSIINDMDSSRESHISSRGRLYIRFGKNKDFILRSQFTKHNGYNIIRINNVNLPIHRLVAYEFIYNPNNYPIINHKDRNKTNNNISNLEWCTIDYNNKHAHNKKVALYDLKGNYIKSFNNTIDLGKFINADNSQVARCARLLDTTVKNYFIRYFENKPIKKIEVVKINNFKKISSYDSDGNLIKTYNSLKEASAELNIWVSSISSCLRGIYPKAGGLIFRYGDSEKVKITRIDNRYSPIVKYRDNLFICKYDSIMDAAKEHNNGFQNISACCKNKINRAYGFRWRYYEKDMEKYRTYTDFLKREIGD